jgi:hypothetical protein
MAHSSHHDASTALKLEQSYEKWTNDQDNVDLISISFLFFHWSILSFFLFISLSLSLVLLEKELDQQWEKSCEHKLRYV